jgi:hypothetical protein
MHTLEIEHTANLERICVTVNGQTIAEAQNTIFLSVELDQNYPLNILVEFYPFGEKPIVRYHGFMLDYWLANIYLENHRLLFTVGQSFFEDYRNKNIQGRIDSLTDEQKSGQFFDKYIGINNLYPEIVNKIKSNLNE